MDDLKYDAQGLICAIAQDWLHGDVRMVAWMNREAIEKTLTTGKATFYSRSRQALWTKGETSGNELMVKSVHLDCDGDTILLRVSPRGPSCHTGKPTCFFQSLSLAGVDESEQPPATFLDILERELEKRRNTTANKSYTRSLLDGGASKIGAKIREEAQELDDALQREDDERVVSEGADVLFHVLVGLRLRGIPWSKVIEALAARSGQSGHEEKASRDAPARADAKE